MNRLVIAAVAAATVLVGCGQPPYDLRYQIVRVNDESIERIDTHTGEIRRFVIVLDGDIAAPSQVRIVRDDVSSLKGCEELMHLPLPRRPRVGGQDATARIGGDTVFFGKSQGGTDEAWA